MANPEHTALLKQGVEFWNAWREQNPDLRVDLSRVQLSGINLHKVNLSYATLNEADLSGTDLSEANLIEAELVDANLSKANLNWACLLGANLSFANLSETNFIQADIMASCLREADLSEALLIHADLSDADLTGVDLFQAKLVDAKLVDACLHSADLSEARLAGANLSRADFSMTDLTGADLLEVNALGTNFREAKFTGACIQDWNINGNTQFVGTICDYVYQKRGNEERCPSSGSFAPGEFNKWIQKVLNTVELILKDPHWEAFAYSVKKVQVENKDEELRIQSIENKGDGVVVVKVNVSSEANKEKIHSSLIQSYESIHRLLIEQYESRIQDKDREINRLFYLLNQANEKLGEVPKLMADSSKVQQTFNITGPVTGFAGNVEGDQNIYTPGQRQSLAEAAAEIQQLLDQLAQINPTSTEVVAEAIHQEIKRNPTLKARLISALKAGGLEALKAIFNHPLFSIPAETVKGWLEAE